jgi:hypothetical protein
MTPIENLLGARLISWTADYLMCMRAIRRHRGAFSLVQHHQGRLGRQTRTFVGEYRYWVWETSAWTLFVSNTKGVGFEVPETATIEEALISWDAYKKLMGVRGVSRRRPGSARAT